MEDFPCIVYIAWKIQKNSDRMLNSGSWIRFDRSCGITTTPTVPNKPIAIGSCAISGTKGVRPIPGIWIRRRLKPSYDLEGALQFCSLNILQLSCDCNDMIGRNTNTSNQPPTVQIFSAALIDSLFYKAAIIPSCRKHCIKKKFQNSARVLPVSTLSPITALCPQNGYLLKL